MAQTPENYGKVVKDTIQRPNGKNKVIRGKSSFDGLNIITNVWTDTKNPYGLRVERSASKPEPGWAQSIILLFDLCYLNFKETAEVYKKKIEEENDRIRQYYQ